MRKCSCGCDMNIVRQCHACSFNDGKKQGVLEELVKQVKDLEIIKKLLTNDIDCVGNLNIVKNRNKLWFLTGEINIVGNQIEKVNNRIKDLENKKKEGCEKQ